MYEDMIDMKWPRENNRPRMALEDRAKIFLPFAALKGFEEAIEEKQRSVADRERKTKQDQEDFFL